MPQQALYRKYRPKTFDDVLGQDHIVDVLKNAISKENISHAYLFSGSRGTGKTSVARILANEIGVKEIDVYEIDAASNRGINDIRELKEAVQALPYESPYKVYIVDEVHMLTIEAFNALLKTLEEPPSHTIFVLATTEIEKLPDTVVSRCEVHHFKKPGQKLLEEMVEKVAKEEGVTFEPGAARLIALIGDGSFRDTQGVLQKVISVGGKKKVSVDLVEKLTGAPVGATVDAVVEGVHKKDIDGALVSLAKAVTGNTDIKLFLSLLLQKIRYVLLLRNAKEMEDGIKEEVTEDEFKMLKGFAEDKESGVTSRVLKELLVAENQVGYTSIPHLPIELALIEVIGDNNA